MNTFFFRIGALLLHALLNIIMVSWLTNYDITGSWLAVTGFLCLLFLLAILFIKHLLSFIQYIKTKTK
jgi:hypothetical protein